MERHQQLVERPRLVAHGDDDRGLVVAGGRHFLVTDDEETRGIVRAVLDLLAQFGQPVEAGRHVAGDGGRVPLALHPLGRIGIARNRHALDVGVVSIQPLAALRQGLGMGVDAGDVVGLGVLTHQQVMVDAQLNFTADHHVVLEEAVQGVVDRTLGGVLHRYDTEVDCTGSHLAEHLVDGGHRRADHRMAEMLEGSRLGEGAFRPQVRHLEGLLQGQAGGHDLAEQPRHFLVIQRPLVTLHDVLEHPGLALGAVEDRLLALRQGRHLHSRHILGAAGTLADQLEDLLVKAVDAQTQGLQFLVGHHARSFSNSAM